jgi:phosphatidylinositol alpha-1,6-mannosyltransferase
VADVLLVTSSFLPGKGGIETLLAGLCDVLSERVTVLAPPRRDGMELPPDLGYAVVPGPGSMLAPGPRIVDAIVKSAAAHGTDKVLFGTPWPLVLVAPRLVERGLRYAVVVHGAETIVPGSIPGVRRRLARTLAGADLLLPVSEYTLAKVLEVLRATRRRVPPSALLRPGVDLTRFGPRADGMAHRRKLGLGEHHKVVLCLGRLVRRKGVHRLIEALPEIAARVPETVAVVAGTGREERGLRRLARQVSAPVVFTGRVADDETPALYASADVFALPVADRWAGLEVEGLGVVLLEAAASGLACVTGRSGGTPEAVLDGITGYVVDARDRAALVSATGKLLSDPRLARRMGDAGRAHVAEHFSGALPGELVDWLAS